MQNPVRLTRDWHIVFGKRVSARLLLRWLLPAALVAVVLGTGFISSSVVVQAQDAGTRSGQTLSAQFVLQVDTSDPKLGRLCIGETVLLPVRVALQSIEFRGGGHVGDWTVRSAQITTSVANPNVVDVAPGSSSSPGASPNTPFQTHLQLTGREAGRTTITINATVQSSIVRLLGEDVALPIPVTSQVGPASVPVRVIPCQIRLSTNSTWVTSIEGAHTVLSVNTNSVMTADVNGGFEEQLTVRWHVTVNRLLGCYASSYRYVMQPGVSVRGVITDDDYWRVTLNFNQLTEGGIFFPCDSPLPETRTRTCDPGQMLDGVCVLPQPNPALIPESLTVEIPIAGGTVSPPQRLDYDGGSVSSPINVTLTPGQR